MSSIKVKPIGGLGEVGMNCMLLEVNARSYLIDCGIMSSNQPWLGFDAILPNLFFLENTEIEGLILTHGHEDHIGGISFFLEYLNIKNVYLTPFTMELVKIKINSQFKNKTNWNIINYNEFYELKDISLRFFKNTHSIVESSLLEIKTSHGSIVHSGDFKIDRHSYADQKFDEANYSSIKDCLLLMSDSTNSEKEGFSGSEADVYKELKSIMNTKSGNIFISFFASNIHRFKMILDIGNEYKKNVVLVGRSLWKFYDIALRLGYLKNLDIDILYPEEVEENQENLIFACTGTQGEYSAAISKISRKMMGNIYFTSKDLYIHSALKIPGNEINIRYMLNEIEKTGCEVKHYPNYSVHTSGHAYAEEQKLLAKLLKPKFFLPIHGDYKMLRQHILNLRECSFIESSLLLNDGEVAVLDQDHFVKTEETFDATKLYCRSREIKRIDSIELKTRKKLAREGVLIFHAYYEDGKFFTPPQIHMLGYTLSDLSKLQIEKNIKQAMERRPFSQEEAVKVIKSEVKKITGWKPVIHCIWGPS